MATVVSPRHANVLPASGIAVHLSSPQGKCAKLYIHILILKYPPLKHPCFAGESSKECLLDYYITELFTLICSISSKVK